MPRIQLKPRTSAVILFGFSVLLVFICTQQAFFSLFIFLVLLFGLLLLNACNLFFFFFVSNILFCMHLYCVPGAQWAVCNTLLAVQYSVVLSCSSNFMFVLFVVLEYYSCQFVLVPSVLFDAKSLRNCLHLWPCFTY